MIGQFVKEYAEMGLKFQKKSEKMEEQHREMDEMLIECMKMIIGALEDH